MPSNRWLGRAGAVADVFKVTIASTWLTDETVTVSINGKSVTATVGSSATTADVATLLKEAWENETLTDSTASYIPEDGGTDFAEHSKITATVSGSVVTFTADDPGEPWVVADYASDALSTGTAQSGGASTIQLAAGETYSDDEINGHVVVLTGGTGGGQWRFISDYTGATDTATVTPAWTTQPDATSTYEIRKCGVSSSHTSASGTAALLPVTRATGPNHVDNVDNWSAGSVPGSVASTDVWVDNSDVAMLYGMLDPTNALTSLNFALTMLGNVGLGNTSDDGYPEFRQTYLVTKTATCKLWGEGQGSGRIKCDFGSQQTAIIVENTGSPIEPDIGAFIWKGTSATNTFRQMAGNVAACPFDGEVADLLTATVASGTCNFGPGLDWNGANTLDVQAGTVYVRTDVATVTIANGTVHLLGAAGIGTALNLNGGTLVHKSSGTIVAANVGSGSGAIQALLDLSQDNATKPITTLTLKKGGRVYDPLQVRNVTTLTDSDVRELIAA